MVTYFPGGVYRAGQEQERSTQRAQSTLRKPRATTDRAHLTFIGISVGLERQAPREDDLWLARVGAANLADAEILFAATLQFGLEAGVMCQRHHEDHSHAHVERAEKLLALEFAQSREVGKNRGNGRRTELDFRLHPAGQHA